MGRTQAELARFYDSAREESAGWTYSGSACCVLRAVRQETQVRTQGLEDLSVQTRDWRLRDWMAASTAWAGREVGSFGGPSAL